jgi:hypothetical protein
MTRRRGEISLRLRSYRKGVLWKRGISGTFNFMPILLLVMQMEILIRMHLTSTPNLFASTPIKKIVRPSSLTFPSRL